jgi:hypothetical protein
LEWKNKALFFDFHFRDSDIIVEMVFRVIVNGASEKFSIFTGEKSLENTRTFIIPTARDEVNFVLVVHLAFLSLFLKPI